MLASKRNSREIYAIIPQGAELEYRTCKVDFMLSEPEIRDIRWYELSYHSSIIMKCRTMIHTFPEVIASPVVSRNVINIIAPSEFFKSEEFTHKLSELRLSLIECKQIDENVYADCLNYTIQCKVAPSWNKVGKYYVEKLDFSSSREEPLDALIVSINGKNKLVDGRMELKLKAEQIEIPCLHLNDFSLETSTIANFLANPNDKLQFTDPIRVYVLPNMTGNQSILCAYRKIPDSSPFRNYEELRSFWEKKYGYDLPTEEGQMIYYDIEFNFYKLETFLYPSVCLAKCYNTKGESTNAANVIERFVEDLKKAVTKICGKDITILEVEKKPRCAGSSSSKRASLKDVTSLSSRPFGYFSNTEQNAILNASNLINSASSFADNAIGNVGSSPFLKMKRQNRENMETMENFFPKKKIRYFQAKPEMLKEKKSLNDFQEHNSDVEVVERKME